MERLLPARLIRFAPIVLPLLAIVLARAMTHSEWAAANAGLATLLFGWIVADSLLLATIAKAKDRRPGLRSMVGAAALASLVIIVGAGAPVRAAILALPPVMAALLLTIVLFVGWNLWEVAKASLAGASRQEAAMMVLPETLVRFMALESRITRLALLGWRRPQDVPVGTLAFSYHRFLLPMIYVFFALQVIELAVMHFLLMQWNTAVAWIWFGLGLAGAMWIIGLAQSFRIYPVLLAEDGLRVRSGIMIDLVIPYDEIAGFVTGFDAAKVKATDTLNHAVLSWPNVMLSLARPIAVRPAVGATRQVNAVALRIDESPAFIEALAARCAGARS